VYSDTAKIASVDHISCLITGPTGTGQVVIWFNQAQLPGDRPHHRSHQQAPGC
jgi:hypothetical protein